VFDATVLKSYITMSNTILQSICEHYNKLNNTINCRVFYNTIILENTENTENTNRYNKTIYVKFLEIEPWYKTPIGFIPGTHWLNLSLSDPNLFSFFDKIICYLKSPEFKYGN